jgi:hypothetical protein
VLELAMASSGCDEKPAVILETPDDLAHLHGYAGPRYWMWAE